MVTILTIVAGGGLSGNFREKACVCLKEALPDRGSSLAAHRCLRKDKRIQPGSGYKYGMTRVTKDEVREQMRVQQAQ